jgi:hypothetical protein
MFVTARIRQTDAAGVCLSRIRTPQYPAEGLLIVPRHYPASAAPVEKRFSWGPRVGEQRWFYRGDEEFSALAERLKLTPCPHCKVVGALIRHGLLRGFDDSSPQRQTIRARRIFCSNRQARRGCGRTFSVWLADKIRRLSLTTGALWRFLQRAAAGSILAAIRTAAGHLSDRTWQRIWKRFNLAQSKIRTALSARCPPPELPPKLPAEPAHRPAAHVLAHLQAAFPDTDCPIAAYQHTLHTFFV